MNIISNCKLCEKHSLHVIGEGEHSIQQCIWCGYVSSEKYKGTKKDNKEFDNLTDENDMKFPNILFPKITDSEKENYQEKKGCCSFKSC